MRKDEWLTPPELVKSLGEFDLDPCSPISPPWETAKNRFTIEDNGLIQPWEGRVWLNPPYDKNQVHHWLSRMARHQNGTALLFPRTDTVNFHKFVFRYAYSILFIKGRLVFYNVDGTPGKGNAGAPSILISYDEYDSEKLEESGIAGYHVTLFDNNLFLIEKPDGSWRLVVGKAVSNLGGEAKLSDIYAEVLKLAKNKVKRNIHYKAKVRQTLQSYFENVERGVWKN